MSKYTFALLLALTAMAAYAADTVWTYSCPTGYIDSSPGIGDLNGDGRKDLVVVTTVGSILALDADATELWRYDTHEQLSISPTVTDVTGGPELEVLVLANSGKVLCLEGGSGAVLWQTNLPGLVDWGRSGIVAADVDGNGSMELVAADSLESLICMTGAGKLLWTHRHPGILCTYPAVGDVNGDGFSEIMVGAMDTPLLCISHEGKELWRLTSGEPMGSSPLIHDITGDGQGEILVGIGNGLSAVDGTGKLLWTYPMRKDVDCAISVADADVDGTPEVFVADLGGKFACLAPDGGLRWETEVEQRVRRNPAIADIDGDGVFEILLAGYSKKLYVFDPKGLVEETIPLDGEANATPTVVDFAGDGRLSVVLPLSSGKMHLFQWRQERPDAAVLSGEFRLNSARTGSPLPVRAEAAVAVPRMDCGNYYVGSNWFEVAVRNAEAKMLEIDLAVLRDGVKFSGTTISSADPEIEGRLLYTLDGTAPAAVTFVCTVTAGGQTLTERRHHVHVTPFMKELADIGRLADETRALLPGLSSRETPENVLYRVAAKLPELKDRAMIAGTISAGRRTALALELAALRSTAARTAALVKAAATAKAGVAVYAANPWAPFGGADELAERTDGAGGHHPQLPGAVPDGTATVRVEAFGGEIESAAVNVFNFSDRPRTFRVVVAPLKQGDVERAAVTVREAIATPTQMLDYSADALPALNEARTISVPPWDARQVWLTVDTAALSPGEWEGEVRLRGLDVETESAAAPVKLTVWQARLPEKQPLGLCHWGYVHTSVLKDQPDAALADQVAHGTNVFVGVIHPKATCDEAGNIVGQIDFAEHDEYVKRHAPHGIILFCGYQGALGGAPQLSDAWKKAHAEYLRAWVRHLADLGVGYDGFALYPVDEPGLSPGLAARHVDLAKIAREADPKILMYTDPVGSCTMEELQAMAPYVDIWCPNRGGYLIKHNADKLAFIKSTGARVWTYECDANAKHQSPLGYYRGQAWLAWHHGLTGIGFWSYCTSPDDPWFRADKEYLLIYQGNGVVPSKRWEAVRDGIEDYSMLAQLRDAADRAEKENRAPETVAEARRLLTDEAGRIADFCGRDQDGTVPGAMGVAGDRAIAARRWHRIQETRKEMAALLEKLAAN